ncbi:hypothetical protein T4E_7048 [Trichinella pseudospiralis]|uniref:Uncharacterized protein n=1 Tax=Trichinella pseudospiralis TaxID=6337 RepID=A0A0V0XQ24_TRIPS|nr:hypothetical protein T4E_7048 [Trichinella pseudospiralis]
MWWLEPFFVSFMILTMVAVSELRLVKIVAVVCHLFFKAGYTKYVLNVQYVLSCYRLFCCRQLDAQVNNGLYLIRREFDSPSDNLIRIKIKMHNVDTFGSDGCDQSETSHAKLPS